MFAFFTTNQANEALPDVIKKYEDALAKTNEIKKIEKQLQLSISSTNSFEEYVPLKQTLNSAITKFYESVEILENTGVVVKSIDKVYLIFHQNALMKKFGFVGNMGKLK